MYGRNIPWIATFVVLSGIFAVSHGLAVFSVDLGSEFMKIAIVKPGVPMEIALNRESQRKTPVIVSIKGGERLIGDPALATATRHPKYAFWYLQDLVGKKFDNPQVQLYKERFPYSELQEDPETGMVLFKHPDGDLYSPEELLGMVLEYARQTAETFAEHPITDAVITVPPYFNQAERRAMARAAKLGGVKMLQLINDNTAVALNYGVFRRKAFNATAMYFMFFNMGASSTTATVVEYKVAKQKNAVTGIVDKHPQLTILGVGYDRTLGGVEFQLRLRNHLAKLFTDQKKTSNDVTKNDRGMAKLFKEAGRLKRVLSANVEHISQVEGLLDDQDFRAMVTREQYEEMCKDLFERVDKVVQDALRSSELTAGVFSEVILMGGGTRMPKVQEMLKKSIGREELGKGINTDEAAAMGAVYQAAYLSKGFRVKKFAVKEANLFPIQVEFDRVRVDDDGKENKHLVKRVLFGRNNPYPQKKVMTFNKHVKDFGFVVNYGDLSFLSEDDLKAFGSLELQRIALSGVEAAHSKHISEAESKGVKAHFRMDESGILSLDKVESTFEKAAPPEGEKEESTLSKIGSTISNLFGVGSKKEPKDGDVEDSKDEPEPEDTKNAGDKEEGKPEEEKKVEKEVEKEEKQKVEEKEQESTDDTTKEDKKEEEKEEKKEDKVTEEKKEDEKKDEKKDQKKDEKKEEKDDKKKDEKKDKKEEKSEKKEEKKKPKPTVIREDISVEGEILDIHDPSEQAFKDSQKKMKEMRKKDEERRKLQEAQNELESFCVNTQDKLEQEDYIVCSTETEREQLQVKIASASDWLYEQDADTDRKAYEDKLHELQDQTKDLFIRVAERQERPQAIEALNYIVNHSEYFLVAMKNYTGEDLPYTEVEVKALGKLINETKEWNKTISEEQANTPDTEAPKLLIKDMAQKISELEREIKYLVNKVKYWKPKTKPEDKDKKSNTTKTRDSNSTETESNYTNNNTKSEIPNKNSKFRNRFLNYLFNDTKPLYIDSMKDSESSSEEVPEEETQAESPPTKEDEKTEKEEILELGESDDKTSSDTDSTVSEKPADQSETSSQSQDSTHDPSDL